MELISLNRQGTQQQTWIAYGHSTWHASKYKVHKLQQRMCIQTWGWTVGGVDVAGIYSHARRSYRRRFRSGMSSVCRAILTPSGDFNTLFINTDFNTLFINTDFNTLFINTDFNTLFSNITLFSNTDFNTLFSNTDFNTLFSNTDFNTLFSNTDFNTLFSNTDLNTLFSDTDFNTLFSNTDRSSWSTECCSRHCQPRLSSFGSDHHGVVVCWLAECPFTWVEFAS